MLARRFSGGLAAAVAAAGMLAAGTVPAQAATHMELQAALHGSHAYPRAGGSAAYESGNHGRELLSLLAA